MGNPSSSQATPLTGRASELGRLAALVDDAAEGRGHFVLIGGEAGIGKTRLCDEAAAFASGRGFVVLRGQCIEGDEALPYLPIVELIEAAADMLASDELESVVGASAHQLAALVPRLAGDAPVPAPALPSEGERLRLFTAVRDFFDRASRVRPLLIVVEDMHWADAATATLVRNLMQFAGVRRVLALATYRPGEVEPPQSPVARLAEDAHRARGASVIQLGELARPDVAEMVERITGAHPGDAAAEALFSQTGGNPFFVEQVLKHLAEENRLFDATGALHLQPAEDEAVPESVRLVIDRRLRRIDERCRGALATAAVLGRGFDCAVLADVDGHPQHELLAALEQAEGARLIVAEARSRELRMAFTHDLIRQTLLTQIPSARRQQLHLRIAEAIERRYGATDDSVADLAHHYLRAGAVADAAHTIDCLVRAAARASAATGFEQAALLYRDAFGLVPPADRARRCELLLLSGEALKRVSDSDEARAAFAEAAAYARAIGDAAQFARAALGFARSWPTIASVDDQCVVLLREALEVTLEDDAALRAKLTSRLALQLLYSGDPERSKTLARESVVLARRSGDAMTLARCLQVLHAALWEPQHLDERFDVATEIIPIAAATGEPAIAMWGQRPRIADLAEMGDFAAVESELEAYERDAAAFRQPLFLWQSAVRRAMLAIFRGQLDEGERLAGRALETGRQAEGQNLVAAFGGQLLVVRWLQGRLPELEPLVAASRRNQPQATIWRAVLAFIRVAQGRKDEARAEFDELAAHDFAMVPRDDTSLTVLVLSSLVAHALDDAVRAGQLYARLAPYAGRNIVVSEGVACVGAADHYLALLSLAQGDTACAAQHFDRALAVDERTGGCPWWALSAYEYARVLLARRTTADRRQGQDLLRAALGIARDCGMRTLQEQIQAMSRDRPGSVPGRADGLTRRELEVLRLVAAGQSTREISARLVLSERTTSRHITNIYAKIGARNRAEAAAYALRSGVARD